MDSEQLNKNNEFEHSECDDDNKNENLNENKEISSKQNANFDVTESGADIMKKINEEAEKLDNIIDKNDIKVFSKYEDLDENELEKLLEEKTQNILKLNNQKEESKNNLSSLLNKINKIITDNYDVLYKEAPSQELIGELNQEIEYKKKECKIAKNMNNSIKIQYNSINNKFSKKPEAGSIEEDALLLNKLKADNKKLTISIRKFKDNLLSKKDEKNEHKTEDFPNIVKLKTDEIRNLTVQKHDYFAKIKSSIKSLENVKNEIKHFEEKLKKQEDKDKNEKLNNKINFWITLIKNDLSGNAEENISRIVKNESNFIKEINKIDSKNKSVKLNNKIKNSSFDEVSDQRDINSNMSFRETNIPYINSSNMNRKSNNNLLDSKSLHKGIFSKFNYLKHKPHSSSMNKNYINNSEEFKINQYNEFDSNSNMEGIIQKDFEETTDNEYRELVEKKSQYLETNLRLEKNIQEIKKTKKSKVNNVYNTVQKNKKNLDDLKEQNNLLENEIMRLQNLFLLTIDKEKLKMEIKEKNKKNKIDDIKSRYNNKDKQIIKSDSSLTTENNILNELKESNDSTIMKNMLNKKKKNKNKSGYMDEMSQEKSIAETREQRLEKIRQKYLYENQDDEINELNTYEEMTKENNIYNDNLINEDDINKEENNIEDKEEIQNEENFN
jgi:hypothetical protein